jgi:hypothetical protein
MRTAALLYIPQPEMQLTATVQNLNAASFQVGLRRELGHPARFGHCCSSPRTQNANIVLSLIFPLPS